MVRNTSKVKKDTDIEPSDYRGLSVIIPAAGMGRRMKSYGPKALIEINKNGTTIIERQINLLWKVYPGAEIFVVIGFEGEKIRKSLQN